MQLRRMRRERGPATAPGRGAGQGPRRAPGKITSATKKHQLEARVAASVVAVSQKGAKWEAPTPRPNPRRHPSEGRTLRSACPDNQQPQCTTKLRSLAARSTSHLHRLHAGDPVPAAAPPTRPQDNV